MLRNVKLVYSAATAKIYVVAHFSFQIVQKNLKFTIFDKKLQLF